MKKESQTTQSLKKSQSEFLEKEIKNLKKGELMGGSSRVLKVLEYALHQRSPSRVLLILDTLHEHNMLQDLRDVHRSIVLRLIAIQLNEFQLSEGRFPELREGSSNELEFLLGIFLHFALNGGPTLFQKESSWEKD